MSCHRISIALATIALTFLAAPASAAVIVITQAKALQPVLLKT